MESSSHPLRGWDVDFLVLEISPAAIPCFSPFWTLGGSAKRYVGRNRVHPFPEGLELANEPFTLRAQPPAGLNDQQVAEWGKRLLEVLKQLSPTGNPCMVPPLDSAVAAKQLAIEPRMCSGTALARALNHPAMQGGFKLFIARYGMKVAAPDFFDEHLMPAMNAMADEIGDDAAMERFHHMKVDWATQAPLSGKVCLLTPLPAGTHRLPWPAKIFPYPMFGMAAGGAGGMTIVSRFPEAPPVGQQYVAKVNMYAAGWVHHFKGAGFPQTEVPANATNSWVSRQRPKLQSLLHAQQSTRQFFLGGLRIEIRTNGSIPTWPSLQRWLQDVVHEAMATCVAHELDPITLINNAQAALDTATAAGVFTCLAADSTRQVTPWRRQSYYRLLHLFGIVNARTAKSSLAAEREARAWGNPATAPHDPATSSLGILHVNPALPPGLPHIPCPSTSQATPREVSRIGMTLGIDLPWPVICAALHLRPLDAETFANVARRTKWRRFPSGRARLALIQFTATRIHGGSMIGPLGDHLILATINLVALGLHDQVLQW